MSTDTIKDLLHEVTDAVEPGDRLDAIRAATAQGGRRTHRGWWTAGGVGLVAASVVTALALSTGGAQQVSEPDPAGPAPTTGTDVVTDPELRAVPVYFVGDTARGQRLYREFQQVVPEVGRRSAMEAALGGSALDRDYRSQWPEGTSLIDYEMAPDLITISLGGDVHDRPAGLSGPDARLAVEQLIRTAQGAYGQGKVPVQLLIDDRPTDQVLGVPASEPLAAGSDMAVLAHVNLSDPFEGQVVDNDEPLTVKGVGTSADARVSLRIQRWEGTAVLGQMDLDLAPADVSLAPFSVDWSIDLQPGEYVVIATTRNPDGTTDTDTRRITVVD